MSRMSCENFYIATKYTHCCNMIVICHYSSKLIGLRNLFKGIKV